MALSPYTVTVVSKSDSPFNIIANAPIEIRFRLANGSSGSLAPIFSDSAGLNPITQVGFTADSDGQATFFSVAAEYNAVFNNGTTTITQHIDTGVTIAVLNERIDRLNPATLAIALNDGSIQQDDALTIKVISAGKSETTTIFDVIAFVAEDKANGIYTHTTDVANSFQLRDRDQIESDTLAIAKAREDVKIGSKIELFCFCYRFFW